MLGQEGYVPGWLQLCAGALWPTAKVALMLAVFVYPWPKGTPLRMLGLGVILLAVDGVWGFMVFSGAFESPLSVDVSVEDPGPGFWDYLGIIGLQFGGPLVLVIGAWRVIRHVVGIWRGKGLV